MSVSEGECVVFIVVVVSNSAGKSRGLTVDISNATNTIKKLSVVSIAELHVVGRQLSLISSVYISKRGLKFLLVK